MTIATTALRLADSVAGRIGLLDRPLDPDKLIQLARRQTGLSDLGDTPIIDPLTRLLQSCAVESALSLVGREATKWDVVRFLTNLLTIQDACTTNPAIEAAPIRRPVINTGLRIGAASIAGFVVQAS